MPWRLTIHSLLLGQLVLPALAASFLVNPDIICYSNVAIVWSFVSFFINNFVAHAVSVPMSAEVGRYTKHVTLQSHFPWAPIVSLFLPFGGLARAILLIAQQLKWRKDNVRAALSHGVLLTIARNSKWEPPRGREDIVYVELPDGFHSLAPEETRGLYASFVLEHGDGSHWEVDVGDHNLHGDIIVPIGYTLAAPADKSITEKIIASSLAPTETAKIHHPQSPLKVLASIFQIFYGSTTLYLSRGDQIERWGYAAYGLSVIPYVLMSFMNMISAGVVGEYAAGHILRTPILEEAEKRDGAYFDGTIGRPTARCELGAEGRAGYVAVGVSLKCPNPPGGFPVLVVRGNFGTKEFLFDPSSEDKHEFHICALSHDGPINSTDRTPFRSVSNMGVAFICASFFIAMILPYVLIYILTGFRPMQSTVSERAWMFGWLIADQLSALGTLAFWIIWQMYGSWIPKGAQVACLIALIIPAIGGFVKVGEMFFEENGFGTCRSS